MRVHRFCLLMLLVVLLASCAANMTASDTTYTSTDGALTFSYPAGWAVRESAGQIFLGTSTDFVEAAASGNIAIRPGQFAASIVLFPADEVSRLDEDAGPDEVLTIVFASLVSSSGIESSPGPITGLTIGSGAAARMEGVIGQNDILLIALEIEPNMIAIFIGSSASGEMEQFEPSLLAIAASLRYESA